MGIGEFHKESRPLSLRDAEWLELQLPSRKRSSEASDSFEGLGVGPIAKQSLLKR